MNKSRGFTTLTITVILLSLLMSVSVFIGKVLVSEKRITLNEIEYRLAQATAEQGLAEALALFKVQPSTRSMAGTASSTVAEVNYTVSITPSTALAGVYQLESVASLPNGGESRVSLNVARRAVLHPNQNKKVPPLMLAGSSNDINGDIRLIADPHGGGSGIPLSLWSSTSVSSSGRIQSCYLSDFDAQANHCVFELSHISNSSQDINGDMQLSAANFPADLLDYIFGYGQAQWSSLMAMAISSVAGCEDINRSGFFIVQHGGTCQLNQVTSSAASPVILLVKDTAVIAATNTQFYGLLVLYDSDPNNSDVMTAQFGSGSQVWGSVVSRLGNNQLAGDLSIIYHAGVQCLLSNCNQEPSSPFVNLYTIPGSWSDH
ncbi:MAG: hypothetical protein ACTHY5_05935 [Oceanisphaera sp.]|uniref:hypothetical protein n=1 Tax=Oceanisphaera sp. TaxID=1929979 RepID=UPI003F9E05AB